MAFREDNADSGVGGAAGGEQITLCHDKIDDLRRQGLGRVSFRARH
jgi:hypothetical protein